MKHRRDLASLLLIVLLAAALRLGRSYVVEYFHDDAMLATLALELADGLSFSSGRHSIIDGHPQSAG